LARNGRRPGARQVRAVVWAPRPPGALLRGAPSGAGALPAGWVATRSGRARDCARLAPPAPWSSGSCGTARLANGLGQPGRSDPKTVWRNSHWNTLAPEGVHGSTSTRSTLAGAVPPPWRRVLMTPAYRSAQPVLTATAATNCSALANRSEFFKLMLRLRRAPALPALSRRDE